ncbi:LysR family transcriptional regulator [Pseudorhodoferax sp.]|uniref:LysR family transcriptional regulator n=1 Tax=Pseudorhodoferax sp. TaxID=1993553 RepID=UPI002DD6431D|nr:LysR family transcriptional regulator [Pseudorhodoferax sp.]
MHTAFSLDQLMMFHEVVESGSLTKAGGRLRMATSTVSRKLASLERQMGTLLLKRNTRRLVPTEVGLDLYQRCGRIAREVQDLGSAAELSRSEVRGTLRVSIPSDFGSGWLGTAISRFVQQHPALRLEIEVSSEPVNLIEQPFDMAIQYGALRDSRLVCKRLATLSRGIYASPGYLRRQGTPATLEQLREHGFVVTQLQRDEGTLQFRSQGTRQRIPIEHRVVVNNMRLARELVLGDAGLAVLPQGMCAAHVASGALAQLLPQWRVPSTQAVAVVLAREGIPRKTRAFLDFLGEHLAADGAGRAA